MAGPLRKAKQRAIGLAGIALAGALLFYMFASVFSGNHPSPHMRKPPALSVGVGVAPAQCPLAFMRPALLMEYYEHDLEHAPPRDPSGCMQRRELDYRAPVDPMRLLRSHTYSSLPLLGSAYPGTEAIDGLESSPAKITGPFNAARPPLSASQLLEVGRAINFIQGDIVAAEWYRLALSKALSEFKGGNASEFHSAPFLSALDQTKALWHLSDYAAMEKRFFLATTLNPPLSAAARRAKYLYADCLEMQGKWAMAADAIMSVQAENERAHDLGNLDRSDIYEMHWVMGLFLARAQRFKEARPYLEAVCQVEGEHTRMAFHPLVTSLTEAGELREARRMLLLWRDKYGRDDEWDIAALELSTVSAKTQWTKNGTYGT